MTDLSLSADPSYNIILAHGINDDGWIIADALVADTQHAVLLIPVPEPSGAVLALAAATMTFAWRCRPRRREA
jgi:hypothetical protein